MEKDIQFAKDMVKCLAGVEFEIIENTSNSLLDYLHNTMDGLLLDIPSISEQLSITHFLQPNCIYELQTAIGLQFLIFLVDQENTLFILGPSVGKAYNETVVRQRLQQLCTSQKVVDRLLNRFSTLPILSMGILHRACLLLIHHLTGITDPIAHKTLNLQLEYNHIQHTPQHNEIPQMREIETRYEISNTLTEAVKQGNLSMALDLLNSIHQDVDNDVRNSNPLRNAQNYCIVLNTQFRHALEDSGIHPYHLDKLSSEIGHEIENMRSVEQSQNFVYHTIQRYCQLVRDHTYPNLKPLIHLAVTYIKEHLNEDLTVKETARILGVNANYLSAQFRKNMGLTFIDFIHKERIAQAAALLKHTNLQIQQIASIIGYNNTSYFTKQFLHFQGLNPSQFRREGVI